MIYRESERTSMLMDIFKLGSGVIFAMVMMFAWLLPVYESPPHACTVDDTIAFYEDCYITTEQLWENPDRYNHRTVNLIGNLTFNYEDIAIWSGKRTWSESIWVHYVFGQSWSLYQQEVRNTFQHCIYSGMIRGVFLQHPPGFHAPGQFNAAVESAELLEYSLEGCFEGMFSSIED